MLFVLLLFFAFSPIGATATFDETFRAGLIALQRGDLAAAESDLQEAAKLQPGNGRVWIALSQTFWRRHELGKAEDAAARAATLGPKDAAVLQSLVIYYVESGQTLKAAGAQAQLAAGNPANKDDAERAAALYFEAARPLLEHEQFAEAIAVLQAASTKLGKHPQTELALGVAYYGQRRFSEAADAFFHVIALAPAEKQPYLFLGKMLDQIPERLPEATERFIAYEKANPEDYEGYLLHAKALDARSMEPEAARGLLEKAIALNPGVAAAHSELGGLLDRLHLFPEAAAEFERAALLDPSDAATHYRLSRLYDRMGKPQAAAAERERHLALVNLQNGKR